MVNNKIIETEALLSLLSRAFGSSTTKVAQALQVCNVDSWEAFVVRVHKEASRIRKATPITSQKVTGSYGPSDTRFND